MAMRSLISKLSGRTGRMPLSAGAVAPKDNPGMKGFSSRINTTKSDSIKQEAEINDFMKKSAEAKRQRLEEQIRLDRKRITLYDVNTALLTVLGLGAAYYLWRVLERQYKGRREA